MEPDDSSAGRGLEGIRCFSQANRRRVPMLSHQPEVTTLIHRERFQQLKADAQQPLPTVSLPSRSFHFPHVLSRLAAFAHIGSAPHHRGVTGRS